ncbi:MAG: hypothetical protein PHS54_04190 [Clostridia bacterium]|nr:hypothetical protein [Clostridia bacterium]
MNFTKSKNGYSIKEVDDYIENMESNFNKIILEKDKQMKKLVEERKKKEKSITLALTAAVEKAKEIEVSSKNIYKLKIEQLTILCSKWEMLHNEMIRKYPGLEDITNVKEDVSNLKSVIKNALKDDFNIDLIYKNPVTDPIRVLLSRLIQVKPENETITIRRKVRIASTDKTELSKLEEKATQIKPIVELDLNEDDKYENLVDKFLDYDEEIETTTKSIFNIPSYKKIETDKFDLNEAVNPKEDLEEIMKAFDFYKNNKRDSGVI